MKRISTLLFCLGLYAANAQVITYSESFTGAASYSPGSPQYDNWISFRAQLDTAVYTFTKITIRGSNDPVGKSCADVGTVNLIATALKDGDPGTSFTCGGVVWRVGDCGGGTELNANNLGTDCLCSNPGYTIRPKVGGGDWGGINGVTCGAASQVMTVEFTYYALGTTVQKALHGSDYDEAYATIRTNDNAHVVTGYASISGKWYDLYLAKLDSAGTELWSKNYGGTSKEYGHDVAQCADSGYVVVGETNSVGAGGKDVYLIRTDKDGNALWSKSYGGAATDIGRAVQETTDGGFIITGETNSFGGVGYDIYLIRTDENGDTLWTRTFGDINSDAGYDVKQTVDGGFIIAGKAYQSSGGWNAYVVKTDANGNVIWRSGYDASPVDEAYSIQATVDGGYIVGGFSSGANRDFFLIKITSVGVVQWSKQIGGSSSDEAHSVYQTSDGGYMLAGETTTFGVGLTDVLLVRTDANGNVLWAKTFGGSGNDIGYDAAEAADGGCFIVGNTTSFGQSTPTLNAYIIKTNSIGNVDLCTENVTGISVTDPGTVTVAGSPTIGYADADGVTAATTSAGMTFNSTANACTQTQTSFQKAYGGVNFDYAHSIKQTSDGGYILGGTTDSYGAGSYDVHLVKTNSNGEMQWSRTYGGTGLDYGNEVLQTSDGGFIVAGQFYHTGWGSYDFYVVKTDANGDTLWTNTYGGSNWEQALGITETNSGGYALTGYTQTYGAGNKDMYVVVLNSGGDVVWDKTYGGTGDDLGNSIDQTTDGGFIMLGESKSFTGTDQDIYVVRVDTDGDTLWTRTYGGTGTDIGNTIRQCGDGGFIIVGETNSYGAGGSDVYLIKTDLNGTVVWSKTYGGSLTEIGNSVKQVYDGGFIIAGETNTFGAGQEDVYLIRTTALGDTLWTKVFGGNSVDIGFDVVQADDGGYAIASASRTFGTPWEEFYFIKTDIDGNSGTCHQGNTNTIITSPSTVEESTASDTASGSEIRNYGTIVNSPATASEELLISTSIDTTHVSCNGGSDGAADLTVSAGSSLSYLWSNSATTQDITNLTQGTYSVRVTDANSCVAYDTVLITEPPLLVTPVSGTDITCNGGNDGTATVTPSGGTPPYNYFWSVGQITPTAINLYAGTYTVNVADLNGCPANNIITLTEPDVMSATIAGTDATCIGGTTGSADLTVSDGTPPYTYAWSNGPATQDISAIGQGTYTVTITDNCATTVVDSVVITQPPALASSISGTDISCNGFNDGEADLTVSGGTLPYTFAWSNSATSEDITSLSPTTYSVTITDFCTISKIDAILIAEPGLLTSSMSKTDVTCYGGGDGTATVTVGGGTGPFNYVWSNGQTTSTAVNLFPGTHAVNIFDVNGCLASNSISVSEPAAPASSIAGTDVTCIAGTNGAADLTVSGGTLPYTYAWSNSATSEDLPNVVSGTYSVTITDACTIAITDSITLTEPPALSSAIVVTDISCNGSSDGSLDLTVSGGTPPYTYAWYTSETTQDIATLDTGSYIVNIKDACSSSLNDTAIVTEPIVLTTTITSDNVTCYGGGNGKATVTAAGGTVPYNYLWNNGQVTSTSVGLFPGNYTVNVTDANGCLASDIVSITQPPALTATIVAVTNVVCNGDSTGIAVVNGSGGTAPYIYLWDDASTQTDSNATSLPAGTYTVLITDNCGATTTQAATINEPPAMSIMTSKTDISCFGYNDGMANVVVSGGTGPFTYSWSPGGDTTANISGLAPGTHMVIVTSSCGNMLTDSAIVAEPTILTTSMASTDVSCNTGGNGTATVTAGGGIPPYNYLWSNGQSDSTAIGLFPGGYSVNITDLNGCLTSDVVTITEPSPMTASLASTPVSCMVGSNGTATVNASDGTLPYTYNWSPSGGTTAVATNLTEDTYTITLTDSCGATIIDSIVVGGPSSMSIGLAGADISCNGFNDGFVDLTVSNGTAPISYLWSNGDTTEDVSGLSPGMYSVTVTDSCGTALTDSLLISEPAPLTTSISSVSATCNGQGDGTASVTVAGGTTPYNYTWNNGQFTSTSFALFPGNYSVNVIDFNGCLVTDLVTITQPDALAIAVTITDATCGEADGSADATVTGGVAPYVYAWSSGGSGATDPALVGGNYSLLVTDTNGCMDSVDVVIPITSRVQEICMITVDSTSTRNMIVWEKPVATNIDSFRIYRDILGTYSWVGSQEYNVDSYFIDSTNGINPQVTSYRYKIATLDACGNESAMGDYHETMHLQINTSGGAANLLWDSYEGFDTTFQYSILRDTTGMGGANFDSINSVTNNNFTYTDLSPPANSTYLVEVVHPWGGCTADKGKNFNSSKSNTSAAGEALSATTSATDASAGGCDGTATVSATGGVQPYTYLWDGSAGFQATATAAGLCAGTYQVTVTDASGDTLVNAQVVGEGSEPPLTASTASTDATAGICNGTATVTASGGTQPYTYVWDGNASSQTTQTATGLCPGTYSVNVFDSLGNMTTVFATVGEMVGIANNDFYEAALSVNPNPFTHSTQIRYTLKGESVVTLEVYNLIGERIVLLVEEEQVAGEFTYTFSKAKENLSAGVYVVALRIDGVAITRRIVALQ